MIILCSLDVEINVFGRNREQLVYLPAGVREIVRKFVTDCAIRRAEIGNHLTTFTNQWNLANQLQGQGDGPQAQRVRDQAKKESLDAAHKALDALVLRVKDTAALVSDIHAA
jgi:hypothetical protein